MATMNFGTMFAGGGGVDIGLMAAGLTPAWAVEYDPAIAGVYRRNLGDHVIVADVRAVDYAALPRVDWLHASPSCVRASQANVNATESDEDVEVAGAVARAIQAQQPRVFTLENVWAYRNFAAFRLILDALGDAGYMYDFEHVNTADFGVPQTRKRLLLRAVHGELLPPLPQPVRWMGWCEAIADLIDDLPNGKLASWQMARMREELRGAVLVDGKNARSEDRGGMTIVDANAPSFTVATGKGTARAVLGGCRVVTMTPRCLARFQSFPDWYTLPDKRTLAARIIGNAVPPLVMEKIAEGLNNGLPNAATRTD